MAKFMFLMRGSCETADRSPEEMQQLMQAMGAWMADGRKNGWLLDPGDGLKAEGRVVTFGETITDGPFAESKELIGGYCMVEAKDMAAAVELARAMPQAAGSTMEVRELAGHSMD